MTKLQGYYSSSKRNRRSDFLIKLLLFMVIGGLAHTVLPWWGMALACFLLSFMIAENRGSAFFAAFLAIFIIWFAHAAYIDFGNEHLLSQRVIKLFPLPESSILLLIITGVLGGIAAGSAAMAGRQIRLAINNKK